MKVLSIQNYSAASFGASPVTRAYKGLRDIHHLHCARCGTEMFERIESEKIASSITGLAKSGVKASEMISSLRQSLRFLAPRECNFLSLMSEYSHKNPDLTFEEILKKPEIIKKHADKVKTKNLKHKQRLSGYFNRIQALLPKMSEEEIKKLHEANDLVYKVSKNYQDERLKRHIISHAYDAFLPKVDNPTKVKKIRNILSKIPLAEPNEDNLMCKYAGHTTGEVLQSLLVPKSATLFHIDKAVKDNQDQMFVVCEKCNLESSNVSFASLFKIFPEFFTNMKRYIADVYQASVPNRQGLNIQPQYLSRIRNCVNTFLPEGSKLPPISQIKAEKLFRENPEIEKLFKSEESLFEQSRRLKQLYERRANLKLANKDDVEKLEKINLLIDIFGKKYSETLKRQ